MKLGSIDYSLQSPALSIFEGEPNLFRFEDCIFASLSNYKIPNQFPFDFKQHEEWESNEERYDLISEWAMDFLIDCDVVAIEGYSMGSKGRVFEIAENCGLLKFKLYCEDIETIVIPPTVIKKCATGKGNADKDMMYKAWLEETHLDLKGQLQPTRKLGNPTTDIVDAYFIGKCAAKQLAAS